MKYPNKRRITKAYRAWKTSTRPRTVKRAGLRWMRFTHRVTQVEVGERVEVAV